MPDPGFVGAAYTAQSPTQEEQECINWYPEIAESKAQGERGVVALYPTPGYVAKVFFTPTGPIRAMRAFPGGQRFFCVVGNTFYEVNAAFLGSVRGTLATTTGPCSITDNGTQLYLCDGPNRYAYDTNTFVFSTVTDGAFTGADRVDFIDNYIIYNKPNSNTWAATNLGSTVSSALSFGRKDSASDNIVTLIVSKREVFVLGERTSEVWVDAGLFPFPFQKLPGANMQHGCAAAQSVALVGESFMWLGQDDRGNTNVYIMEGYTAKDVATFALQNEMNGYAVISDAIAYSYQENGHEFYVLNFPTADKTWVYDYTTGLWHRRATVDAMGVLHRDHGISAMFFQNLNLIGDKSNGFIYSTSLTSYTDYSNIGNQIPRIRSCRHLTADLKNVFHHSLQIQFQPGVGLASGQGSDPQAMLQWSDDGGFTWSNEHWTSIGKIGKYKNRARWQALGVSRDRIYKVMVRDPVNPVIVSAELVTSAGGS